MTKISETRKGLIKAAEDAINAVADDKSVSAEQSIEDLENLRYTAFCCISGLHDDLKGETNGE